MATRPSAVAKTESPVLPEMSRPGCESGRPVNGFGARAEARREPAHRRPDRRRRLRDLVALQDVGAGDAQVALERAERAAEQAEGVLGRAGRRRHDGLGVGAGRGAALGLVAHQGRQRRQGRARRRIQLPDLAQGADRVLQLRDLSGQLAGRGAEAGVLLAQHAGGGAQVIELGRRAPARAQPDQDRQREQTDHGGQGRPEAQVEPPDHARGAVGDENGIAAGQQTARIYHAKST